MRRAWQLPTSAAGRVFNIEVDDETGEVALTSTIMGFTEHWGTVPRGMAAATFRAVADAVEGAGVAEHHAEPGPVTPPEPRRRVQPDWTTSGRHG